MSLLSDEPTIDSQDEQMSHSQTSLSGVANLEHYTQDNTNTIDNISSNNDQGVQNKDWETTPVLDLFGSTHEENENNGTKDQESSSAPNYQTHQGNIDNEGSGLITQTMILGSQNNPSTESPQLKETEKEKEQEQEQEQEQSYDDGMEDVQPLNQSTLNKHENNISSSSIPDFKLSVTVKDPITETEGSNTFTSYHLHIKTNNPKLQMQEYTIMHRYSDFDTLYQCFSYDFPTLLIPPLPNKQRLEYIKGGRFTDEFVTKRCNSLNTFMQRVTEHPILRKSEVLLIFLENNEYWKTYRNNLTFTDSNVINNSHEGVTDFLMNSFKKPHIEGKFNKNFKEIDYQRLKLQENLNKIDKIYTKVISKQDLISKEFNQFGEEFNKLSILLNNDYDGKHREDTDLDEETRQIVSQFKKFSDNLKKSGSHYNDLNKSIEFNYLNNLKDLEHYLASLGNSIKLKDYKILDYEMLNNYLEKTIAERDNLINGGSLTATTEGTISYLSRKFESITGLGNSHPSSGNQSGTTQTGGTDSSFPTDRSNSSNLVNERIGKLNTRIDLLKKEAENAKVVYESFERDLLGEWSHFQHVKNNEISSSMSELSQEYKQLYGESLKEWNSFNIAKESIDLQTKLQNDDAQAKYFGSSQVMQNHEEIQKLIRELES